jgi:hypothetical protein
MMRLCLDFFVQHAAEVPVRAMEVLSLACWREALGPGRLGLSTEYLQHALHNWLRADPKRSEGFESLFPPHTLFNQTTRAFALTWSTWWKSV